ncbi:Hypothetical_protein [Hexamita inflata]|uniref:Hypothetical_protein n=1 Tax=Hexamita inflata TaxID=28002 RepID=A0AA86P1S1_9EUKA|nr:Hypothetical protein HINF_LOCUS17180 [Hexamita inflata]
MLKQSEVINEQKRQELNKQQLFLFDKFKQNSTQLVQTSTFVERDLDKLTVQIQDVTKDLNIQNEYNINMIEFLKSNIDKCLNDYNQRTLTQKGEISIIYEEIKQIQIEQINLVEMLEQQKLEMASDYDTLNSELHSLRLECEQIKRNNSLLHEQNGELAQKLQFVDSSHSRDMEKIAAQYKTQQDHLQSVNEKQAGQILQYEEEVNSLNLKLQGLSQEYQETASQAASVQQELRETKLKLDNVSNTAEMSGYQQQENEQLQQQISDLKNNLETLSREKLAAAEDNSRLKSQLSSISEHLQALQLNTEQDTTSLFQYIQDLENEIQKFNELDAEVTDSIQRAKEFITDNGARQLIDLKEQKLQYAHHNIDLFEEQIVQKAEEKEVLLSSLTQYETVNIDMQRRLRSQQQKLQECQQKLEMASDYDTLNSELHSLRLECEQIKRNNSLLHEQNGELAQKLQFVDSSHSRDMEKIAAQYKTQQDHLQSVNEKQAGQILQYEEEVNSLNLKLQGLSQEYQETASQAASVQQELRETKLKLDNVSNTAEMSGYQQQENEQLQQQISDLKNNLETLSREKLAAAEDNSRLKSQLSSISEHLQALQLNTEQDTTSLFQYIQDLENEIQKFNELDAEVTDSIQRAKEFITDNGARQLIDLKEQKLQYAHHNIDLFEEQIVQKAEEKEVLLSSLTQYETVNIDMQRRLRSQQQKLQECQQKLEMASDYDTLNSELHSLRLECEQIKRNNSLLHEQNGELAQKLQFVDSSHSRDMEKIAAQYKTQQDHLQSVNEKQAGQILQYEEEVNSLNLKLQGLSQEYQETASQAASVQQELRETKLKLDNVSNTAEMSGYQQQENEQLQQQISDLKNNLETLSREKLAAAEDNSRLKSQLSSISEHLQALQLNTEQDTTSLFQYIQDLENEIQKFNELDAEVTDSIQRAKEFITDNGARQLIDLKEQKLQYAHHNIDLFEEQIVQKAEEKEVLLSSLTQYETVNIDMQRRLRSQQQKLQECQQKLEMASDYDTLNSELHSLRLECEQIKRNNSLLHEQNGELAQKLQFVDSSHSRDMEKIAAQYKTQQDHLQSVNEKQAGQILQYEEEVNSLNLKLQGLSQEYQETASQAASVQQELRETKLKLDNVSNTAEMSGYQQQENEQLQQQISDLKNNLETLSREKLAAAEDNSRLKSQLSSIQLQIESDEDVRVTEKQIVSQILQTVSEYTEDQKGLVEQTEKWVMSQIKEVNSLLIKIQTKLDCDPHISEANKQPVEGLFDTNDIPIRKKKVKECEIVIYDTFLQK